VLHLMKPTQACKNRRCHWVGSYFNQNPQTRNSRSEFDLIRESVVKMESFLQRMGLLQLLTLVSFVSVIGISILLGNSYFAFLEQNMLRQEMTRSTEQIQTISLLKDSESYFQGNGNIENKQDVEKFFQFIINSPNIFRINVHDANYKVIWSNEPNLIGMTFKDNEELKIAYTGKSNFSLGKRDQLDKDEHDFLPEGVDQFIESYMPVWDEKHEYIFGVVETYKSPKAVFEILETIELMIGLASLLGGILLYSLLYWIRGMVYHR